MALKSVGFEVLGRSGDVADLRIFALANGLAEDEFTIVLGPEGPLLRLDSEAIRRLGGEHGHSLALH
jgi:hypothetical protein